jgi:hypothetical protein
MLLAGCGANAPSGTLPTSAPPQWVAAECPKDPPKPPDQQEKVEGGGVPSDFQAAYVLRCADSVHELLGQGVWRHRVVERADGPAQELVDQLRRPSDAPTAEACTADMVIPPHLVLVNAEGKAIRPAFPQDSCGKPRLEARQAVERMSFRVVEETPVEQVQSQQSIDVGCDETYKDVIALTGADVKSAPASPIWQAPFSAIGVCVYDSAGKFVAGHTVRDEAAKALGAMLDAVGPASACSTPHTSFAVLTVPGGASASLELDGCRRLLRTNNTFGQLDEATITVLRTK